MSSESKYYKEVINKLERVCRKKYLSFTIWGFAMLLLTVIIFITLFSLLELVFNFNSSARTVLFIAGCLSLTAFGVNYIFIPVLRYFGFRRSETYFQVAYEIGESFPAIKDNLLNSMQLVSSVKSKSYYSVEMINAAFKNAYNKTKNIRFESIIKFDKVKKLYSLLSSAIVLFVLLFLSIPGLKAASSRLLNFNHEFIKPPLFAFDVSPGNSKITKGEDVLISVSVEGKTPDYIYVAIKNEGDVEFKFEKITADSSGEYDLNLKSVKTSFKYFATAQNIKSDDFEISVIDRPIVKTLELEISPPAYSNNEKIIQRDNGNVTSLVGSEVVVNISSTKQLIKSFINFSDSTNVKFETDGNEASGKFTVRNDNNYIIKLFDDSGVENSSPIIYHVQALHDRYPSIEMVAPNMNISLANDNRVNLIADIDDDYGFSKLLLNYRLSQSRYEVVQPEFKQLEINLKSSKKELSAEYIWNLSSMSLGADDVVSYYLEVFDNDNVSGPKSTKTPIFTVRVPSLDEILADAEETQGLVQDELIQTLKEAEELQKSLEEIDQDLKKDKEKLSWEEKEKIENALDKFDELQKKAEKLSDELRETQNELQQNDLLSQETLEKYMELQELMDKLTSEEMKKAMERLQEKLQQMNRKMTQDQLESFKMDEERFKKSIERTLNLLKRIQVEQKVDEIIKRTEEVVKEQAELKERTEKNDPLKEKEKNNLTKRQDDITDKIDRLEEEMKKLDEKMSEINDMPEEELEKIIEKMEEQKNKQKSEKISQDIQKDNMQQVVQQQQQIENNMSELNQQMQELQASMMSQNMMQTFTGMMKMLDNIIETSKMQEELKNETESMEPNSSSYNDEAEKQDKLKGNLSGIMKQMAELSQKTFAITPEMGKALGNGMKQMQQSIQSLQNRNGSFAAMSQAEAMKNLNEAASMMKNMMETLMQGGGGGGMMSMIQQLQQLSTQQMDLNRMTRLLQQLQQGQLSPQQQGELQRLAQQQELIRKSLAQLNQEAKISGESKKIPADLDNILNQMQEVLTNMNSEKLDDDLIQKQERILSKLLDAQRSINERDFEKERESNSGINIVRKSPTGINLNSDEGRNKLRDELNKAVQEGYARDYEELILKYFEAVQEGESNK